MYKIWIDTDTGEWGWMTNLKTLDVHWWDEFEDMIKDMSPAEIVRLGRALGKTI